MKLTKYLFAFIWLGVLYVSFSCNKPSHDADKQRAKDSLSLVKYVKATVIAFHSDRKKGIAKIDSIMPYLKQKKFDRFQMNLYGLLSTDASQRDDTIKARQYQDSIKALAFKNKDSISMAIYHNGEAKLQLFFGDRNKAFEHYQMALRYNKGGKDAVTYINTLVRLLYFSMEDADYATALEIEKKVVQTVKDADEKATLSVDYACMAYVSYFLKDPVLMRKYLDSASRVSKKYNDKQQESSLRLYFGMMELLEGNNKKAIDYFNQDLKYCEKQGIKTNILNYSFKIKAFENLNLHDSIDAVLKKAKEIDDIAEYDRDEVIQYYPLKIKYSQGAEKIEYMQKYIDVLNKIIEENRGIQAAKIQFGIERKALEDNLQKERELKRKNNFIYLLAFLLTILAAVIFILFINAKRNKLALANKKLELDILQTSFNSAKIERERISRELHDDLGATFTSISMATQMLKEQQGESSKYIDIISNNATRMNQKVNEIIWSLNTRNDTLGSLTSYLTNFSKKFLENTPVQLLISKNEEVDKNSDKFIPSDKRRMIYLTCKEIINNTVKHAEATKIKLDFSLIKDELSIVISDNGKGIDTQNAESGNGLKNIKENMEYISANYRLETSEKGTIHTIFVKI